MTIRTMMNQYTLLFSILILTIFFTLTFGKQQQIKILLSSGEDVKDYIKRNIFENEDGIFACFLIHSTLTK